jgi:hypothetical protein
VGKIATVKLGWTKSASADVAKVDILTTIGGTQTTTTVGPEVESIQVDVAASTSFSFQVVVTDSEGLTASSEIYAFTLGDLTDPLPATDLFHQIIAVRDDTPPSPPPTPAPDAAKKA